MKKVTVDELGPLIEQNRGNIAAVARALGVSRGTIHNRINESVTLKQVLTDARESMLDNAESVLYKKVLEGSTPELLFFLKTQGRNRGYVERHEVSGPDGGAIEHRDVTEAERKILGRMDSIAGRSQAPAPAAPTGPDADGAGGA